MDKKDFIDLVKRLYNTDAERPFSTDQETLVFRHTDNKKWFAIVMNIPYSKLNGGTVGETSVVNLKCDQAVIQSMWQEKGIYPAYHMSKAHWLTVVLDGSVDSNTVTWLLEMSYKLTRSKLKIKHKKP